MIARASIGAPRVRGPLRRLSRCGILGAVVAGMLIGAGPAGAAPPAIAARVQARFDLDAGAPSPFPADWFTVPDRTQRTGLRIANPPASCAPPRSVCDDLKLLAELDGFDLEPRLALRFTGGIDLGSVSARSVFLVRLGAGPPEITGVDRLVWDPATFTLYARPESVLEPETRYGLVVTRELRDSGGRSVEPSAGFVAILRSGGGPPLGAEQRAAFGLLRRALERRLIRLDRVVVASVFTTGSVSAFLEQARDALDRRPPAPALMTAPEGGGRAWFARGLLSRLVLRRQIGAAGAPPAARHSPGQSARRVPGRRAAPRGAAERRGRRRRDRLVLVALVPLARAPDLRAADPRGPARAERRPRRALRDRDADRPPAAGRMAARGVRARLRRRDALERALDRRRARAPRDRDDRDLGRGSRRGTGEPAAGEAERRAQLRGPGPGTRPRPRWRRAHRVDRGTVPAPGRTLGGARAPGRPAAAGGRPDGARARRRERVRRRRRRRPGHGQGAHRLRGRTPSAGSTAPCSSRWSRACASARSSCRAARSPRWRGCRPSSGRA